MKKLLLVTLLAFLTGCNPIAKKAAKEEPVALVSEKEAIKIMQQALDNRAASTPDFDGKRLSELRLNMRKAGIDLAENTVFLEPKRSDTNDYFNARENFEGFKTTPEMVYFLKTHAVYDEAGNMQVGQMTSLDRNSLADLIEYRKLDSKGLYLARDRVVMTKEQFSKYSKMLMVFYFNAVAVGRGLSQDDTAYLGAIATNRCKGKTDAECDAKNRDLDKLLNALVFNGLSPEPATLGAEFSGLTVGLDRSYLDRQAMTIKSYLVAVKKQNLGGK